MMIATILFARSVLVQSKQDIRAVQAIEYGVYRHLIGVAGYTAVCALRGEIGTSLMESRMMESTILLAKDGLEGDFDMVNSAIEFDRETEKGEWIRTVNQYLETLNISWDNLIDWDKKTIKLRVKEYDTDKWQEEMMTKPTLHLYMEAKLKMGYEECYTNSYP